MPYFRLIQLTLHGRDAMIAILSHRHLYYGSTVVSSQLVAGSAIDPKYDVMRADVIMILWKVYVVLSEVNRSPVCYYTLKQCYSYTNISAILLNRCISTTTEKPGLKPKLA